MGYDTVKINYYYTPDEQGLYAPRYWKTKRMASYKPIATLAGKASVVFKEIMDDYEEIAGSKPLPLSAMLYMRHTPFKCKTGERWFEFEATTYCYNPKG